MIEELIKKQMAKEVDKIDMSQYKSAIERAVVEYLDSGEFLSDLCEGFHEQGIGYELGQNIAPRLIKELKKIKIG